MYSPRKNVSATFLVAHRLEHPKASANHFYRKALQLCGHSLRPNSFADQFPTICLQFRTRKTRGTSTASAEGTPECTRSGRSKNGHYFLSNQRARISYEYRGTRL